MNSNRAVVVNGIDDFEIVTRDIESPGPGEVLIKVSVTGMCRTDLKIIRAGHRDLVLPRVPGEEVVGRVVAAGQGATHWQIGSRVYVYPGSWCGRCGPCKAGAENLCRQMRIMGFHRDGGFAQYVVAPAQSLIAVPDGLDDETAVLAEPLSCVLNALNLARLTGGERICVWGAGPAGMLCARAARARGATADMVEPLTWRRDSAGAYSKPPGEAYDVCIVAVGDASAYMEAVRVLGPRGRMVIFSGLPKENAVQPIDLNELHYREQTLVGAYGCVYRDGADALTLLASGNVPVADLITHRLPLWDIGQALDLVERRESWKILLFP